MSKLIKLSDDWYADPIDLIIIHNNCEYYASLDDHCFVYNIFGHTDCGIRCPKEILEKYNWLFPNDRGPYRIKE